MGAYNSTYIGVYLEIPYIKVEKTKITYTHPNTGNKMSNKFCPDTGLEGILHEKIETKYSSPCHFIDEDGLEDGLDEDTFFAPEYTGGAKNTSTFILNRKNKFAHSDDGLFNYSIDTNTDIESLISEFKSKYSDYLDYFVKNYDIVNIKYGVVNYAH
jgi:hypothetical protein